MRSSRYQRRGSDRGRGRAGFRGAWRGSSPKLRPSPTGPTPSAVTRASSPPLGRILHTIKIDDLGESAGGSNCLAKISDCRYVGSYSLTNDKCPTILVPGKPPIWQPPTGASQLEEDSGEHFRDINAAHFPLHPTEPTVRALFVCNPTFPSQDIDVVACNSTLGNLLKFVRKLDNSFRFSVEFVGDTAFFVRRENSPTETIPDLRGYGHSFPEAYCEWEPDVRGSISHQRLIQYTFAGLDCVVRYKCDGYLKDKATKTSITAMDLNPTMDLLPSVTLPITRIAGAPIVQESLFDLKTRSAKRKENDTLGEELGHLWLTQTHNFVLAYHERGLFNDIRVTSIRDDVLEWESDNEETLDKLASLIREILAFVKGTVNGKCEIRRRDSEILEIREQTEDVTAALPLEVASLWRAGGPTNVSDNSDDHVSSAGRSDDERYCMDDGDGFGFSSDEESEKDFTACSAEDCGYCGHCQY